MSASTPPLWGHSARHIVWHRWEEPGIEHLYLREAHDRVVVDSMIVGVIDEQLMRLRYEVQCDAAYQFQAVHVQMLQPFQRTLTLTRSHDGTWRDGEQKILPEFADAFEIDLTVSPFTNTLPIRRLSPHIDQPVEILVAYIDLPAFSIRPERQLYTLTYTSSAYNIYRFEQPSIEYTQDIRVDSQGYVIDYPGLFQRVHTQ
ncbi:MAG: putative glycolipid-binding domain-containing protein [Chloroflexi bacterium]|nr:putative glycolipid-binding domain-containing protein [Chloroflexota bacterium]